jgi:hypothetical protein
MKKAPTLVRRGRRIEIWRPLFRIDRGYRQGGQFGVRRLFLVEDFSQQNVGLLVSENLGC